jgi:hypothetical protein
VLNISTITTNRNRSLVLLNEYALNAALSVPTREDQKLIKKKDVKPIISHPKNKLIRLPEETKKTMLIINIFKKRTNLSTKGSYLKYEKVYTYTN